MGTSPTWLKFSQGDVKQLDRNLTSDGSVSSTKMLGPVASGPKAQIDRAAKRSQSYLVWKNSPSLFLGQVICTTSFSISSANPFSKGSAIMVNLFLKYIHRVYMSSSSINSCVYCIFHTWYILLTSCLEFQQNTSRRMSPQLSHRKRQLGLLPWCLQANTCTNENLQFLVNFMNSSRCVCETQCPQ